jgi:hypothetical protein
MKPFAALLNLLRYPFKMCITLTKYKKILNYVDRNE